MDEPRSKMGRYLAANNAWLAPAVLAAVCLGPVTFALRQLTFATLGRDQGIFQYVAWAIQHGERAYRDFHEINGPLPHLWHFLLQRVGGEDEHVFRSIDTAVLVAGYTAACATIPRWVGLAVSRRASLAWALGGLAVLGAQYVRYDWWHTSQREGLYAVLVLVSIAFQALGHDTRITRDARVYFFFAGLFTAFTWFGKPPCVVFALMQAAVAIVDRKSLVLSLSRALVSASVGAAVVSLGMLWFVSAYGDVGAAARMLSTVPLLHHTIWNESIAFCYSAWGNGPRLDWAMGTAVIFVAAHWYLKLPRRALLAMVLPVGGFVIFAGQGKGFPYHLHMVTLGTSAAQLVVLAGLVRRGALSGRWAGVALAAALALSYKCQEDARRNQNAQSDWATAGATKERRASREYLERFGWGDFFAIDLREAAAYIAAKTTPDERVQTYGLDPYILFLAKRRSATPILYDFELNVDAALRGGSGAKPSEEQRQALLAYRDGAEKLVLDRVQADPPAAFVFFDKAPFSYPEDGEQDFAAHCPQVYAWLDSRYASTIRFGAVRVRLRKDVAGRPGRD
jgi:hypothetical protein